MIEVRLLGRPAIVSDGASVPEMRGRKAWGLLAYLLLTEVRNPSREHLAELLFSETDDPLRSLRWNLSELRRALGPGVVPAGSSRLVLPADSHVDVHVLLRGTSHEALALDGIGHPLLEAMDFTAARGFDGWITHERHRLEGASAAALHEAVLDHMAAGEARDAVALARRLVEVEPHNENFQEALIRALAQAGDPAAAQKQLEACTSLFVSDLGREPDESLARAAGEVAPSASAEESGSSGRHAAAALIDAGEAAVSAGATDPGLQNLRRALTLAGDAGLAELEVRARVSLGSALVHSVRGRDEEAASVLNRGAALARRLGLDDLAATATRELSYTDALAGRYARCESRLAEASALASSERELAAIESVRALTAADRGAHRRALSHLAIARELAESAGDLKRVAHASTFAGRSHFLMGELEAARRSFERAIAIVAEVDWLSFASWPHAWLAELQLAEGDLAGSRTRIEHAFALACEFRDPCWEGMSARVLGLIEEREGQVAGALRRLEDARARASRGTDRYLWVEAYALESFAAAAVRAGSKRAATLVEDLHSLTARTGMRGLAVKSLLLRWRLGATDSIGAARALAAEIENPALDAELRALPARA